MITSKVSKRGSNIPLYPKVITGCCGSEEIFNSEGKGTGLFLGYRWFLILTVYL